MIDRSFIVKNSKKISEHDAKKLARKVLTGIEKSSKKRNNFTQKSLSI